MNNEDVKLINDAFDLIIKANPVMDEAKEQSAKLSQVFDRIHLEMPEMFTDTTQSLLDLGVDDFLKRIIQDKTITYQGFSQIKDELNQACIKAVAYANELSNLQLLINEMLQTRFALNDDLIEIKAGIDCME